MGTFDMLGSLTLAEALWHLGQQSIPVEAIFREECKVLAALNFSVSNPTALELLDAIVAHRKLEAHTPKVRTLAVFLLRLSLFDVPLHFRYPHIVLAAAALQLASKCYQNYLGVCNIIFQDADITAFASRPDSTVRGRASSP